MIVPIGLFPQTASFTKLSFVNAPDPLTGHSYHLHNLQVFVGTGGLTFVQDDPLPSTPSSDHLTSSVFNLIRRPPIHLLPPASAARRSPRIYPTNRIPWHRWPWRIWYYKMCSMDCVLWCWDATTQVASDDAPSQRRLWRGVLSFSVEVRACQDRVTLPVNPYAESVRLTSAPLFDVFVPNTLYLLYNLSSLCELLIVWV